MKARKLIWSSIAAIGVADILLVSTHVISVAIKWRTVIGAVFLLGVSFAYRSRSSYLSNISHAAAQLVVFSYLGALLTYGAMAASPFLLADPLLSRADVAVGFDWLVWFHWVRAHSLLHITLAVAYASIPVQGIAFVAYFSHANPRRVDELIFASMLSILICTPIEYVLPAIGAWSQHGVGIEPWRADILALRSHTLFVIKEPNGIVSFPSYHAALAIVLSSVARGRKWFGLVVVLNALMILSVMTEGAHYSVDMIGGVVVAAVAVAITQWLLLPRARFDLVSSDHVNSDGVSPAEDKSLSP